MAPFPPDNFETVSGIDSDAEFLPEIATTKQPSILIATTDPGIQSSMMELFRNYRITTMWATCMEEIKVAFAKSDIAACFCGFRLVDGTYRDVVRHLKRASVEVPIVIVCAPTCPQEYRDYLAALNIRAFDYICHPYRKTDLERILNSAIPLHEKLIPAAPSVARSSEGAFRSADLRQAS